MFSIDPRQAVLASVTNTCTAGIMTLHFPFPCSPQWAEKPCKVNGELNGAGEGTIQPNLQQPPSTEPPNSPGHFRRGERNRVDLPIPARVTVSLQNHTSARSINLKGAEQAS